MAINRIVTGQTFGNWLDITNQIIDDLNSANANKNPGKLVRYNNTGSLTIHDVTANSIILANGTRIDRINTDYTTFEDDNSILTANAVYSAIRAEDKTTIKDTPYGVPSNSSVSANSVAIDLTVNGSQKILVSDDKTEFFNDIVAHQDLIVYGTRTTLQTQSLEVADNNIFLNKNGDTTTAEGAGFEIGSTNAHFRLINTGNRYPIYNVTDTILFNNAFKVFQLGSTSINRDKIIINEKDRLTLTYTIPAASITLGNTVPIAIGTTFGPNRETNVLEPSTSTIEYKIGSTVYNTYADYKSAFLNAVSSTVVTLTFDPKLVGKYYYWAGNIDYETRVREVNAVVTTGGQYLIDEPVGGSIENNPDIEMMLGDTFTFTIPLNEAGQNTYYFAIGTKPFSDDTRLDMSNIVYDNNKVTYEIDGNVFNPTYNTFAEYISTFTSGTANTANITFFPTSGSDIKNFYYWSSANNQVLDTGGKITVAANNTYMGGEIDVTTSLGKFEEISITHNGTVYNLDGAPDIPLTYDAGDTVKFVSDPTVTAQPIVIGSSVGTPFEYADGVLYELDGVKANSTFYLANYASASQANVTFTPDTAGTYYYWDGILNTNGSHNENTITFLAQRTTQLNAYSLSTDDATARIENPNEFNFTKYNNTILKLDGILADFSGTKSGLVLPSETLDYTPSQNGIIRFNPTLNLFEGYAVGQWRGLGGVIDLNQDTFVEAGDLDDTIYYSANGTVISEMRDTDFYLNSNASSGADTGLIEIKSNDTLAEFSVKSSQTISGTSKNSSIILNGEGVTIDSKGYLTIPVGSLSERPSVAANGMIRFVEGGLQIVDSSNPNSPTTEYVNSLEMYDGVNWEALSTVVNEYTITIASNGQTDVTVTGLTYKFEYDSIDVYLDGLRLQKSDYALSSTGGSPHWDSTLTFTPRKLGQMVTIVHQPGRKIGITKFDALNRSELLSGFSAPVTFSGVTTLSAMTPSTSVDSGSLVVMGGAGISGDLFVGRSITELSAAGLKTNISGIESALDKVKNLKGVEFNWIDEDNANKEYGLIAEEVASVTPNLVSYNNNKPAGVKYSKIVALLIEAMKQQQDEIQDLKNQVSKKTTSRRKTKSN